MVPSNHLNLLTVVLFDTLRLYLHHILSVGEKLTLIYICCAAQIGTNANPLLNHGLPYFKYRDLRPSVSISFRSTASYTHI
jgi:hypothetical protein